MDLPKGWAVSKFEDTVQIMDTFREPINNTERMQRIEGKQISELFPYYGATGLVGYIDGYLLDGEYVLLGEDGAPFLDGFANKAYIVKGKVWVNNHAHVLLSCLSNRFLCYYLNQLHYKEYVSGTTRLKLTQGSMKRIPIIIPPLAEQNRIVDKVDALSSELDKGVEMLQIIRQQLRKYQQAVLKWAFEGIDESKRIDECFEITGGLTKNSNRNVFPLKMPYLRVANVYSDFLDLKEIKYIGVKESEIERTLLQKGDLLFVEGNGSREQIGRVAQWNGEIENCLHQNHIIKGRPIGNMLGKYAIYFLMTENGRQQIREVSSSTSGLYTLSINKIKALLLPYCSLPEQERIIADIESRLSVCDKLEQIVDENLHKAQALKQSILKKAFAGHLVPQDSNDEPASILLEHIRESNPRRLRTAPPSEKEAGAAKAKAKGGGKNG